MATMSRFARCKALVLLTLSAIPPDADTQSRPFGPGTAVGATVQWIGTDDEVIEAPAVALHVTSIRRSGLAFDFGLATLPMALADGELILAPDISIAGIIPIWGGGLFLKGGPSFILLEGGTAGGLVGAHLGAGVFVRTGKGFGIRAEVIPRVYAAPMVGGFVVTTYGIGFTSLPRRP
jgi:hypothetical protein